METFSFMIAFINIHFYIVCYCKFIRTRCSLLAYSPQLHEFEITNPDSVPEGELFEKDILLTPRQRQEMKTRKGLSESRYRWQTPVPYIFADSKGVVVGETKKKHGGILFRLRFSAGNIKVNTF